MAVIYIVALTYWLLASTTLIARLPEESSLALTRVSIDLS
jgi:hypothetical protein